MLKHTMHVGDPTVTFDRPGQDEIREALAKPSGGLIAASLSHMQDWPLAEQQGRMARLNALYAADCRDEEGHPYRGCYTGLLEKEATGQIGNVHWRLPDHKTGNHFAPVEKEQPCQPS